MTPAAAQLAEAMGKPKKRPKYGNKIIKVEGVTFHSMAEYNRWLELQLLQRAGKISNLRRQVPYEMRVNGGLAATYVADHVYTEDGEEVVEDVKSPATRAEPTFRLKARLMQLVLGIDIRVVP